TGIASGDLELHRSRATRERDAKDGGPRIDALAPARRWIESRPDDCPQTEPGGEDGHAARRAALRARAGGAARVRTRGVVGAVAFLAEVEKAVAAHRCGAAEAGGGELIRARAGHAADQGEPGPGSGREELAGPEGTPPGGAAVVVGGCRRRARLDE